MKSFRIFCACVLASLLLALPAWALAAPQVIRAAGTYAMGDNDSPKIARDAARQEALRITLAGQPRTNRVIEKKAKQNNKDYYRRQR